jgi:hypothetical protein
VSPPAEATTAELAALRAAALVEGLAVHAWACWPETEADDRVEPLAGFIESTFSPLLAAVAGRALQRRREPADPQRVTGVILVTRGGDATSASLVAQAVDAGERVRPLLFFQCVPTTVVGYLAARWGLTGPVVCLADVGGAMSAAALLVGDGDADEVLVACLEVGAGSGDRDRAAAVVVGTGPPAGAGP